MKKIEEITETNILIDTNILIHYAEEGFIDRSNNPLGLLRDNRNKLFVSNITGFELLRGKNDDEKREKFLSFLNYIPNLPIDKDYLNNGVLFADEHRRLCGGKNMSKPGDLIIAGTIVSHELADEEILLFTTDRKDFCEPLWETITYHLVQESGGEYVQHCFYLLKLNTNILAGS
jgi:predicted nucleic acid-binding protein